MGGMDAAPHVPVMDLLRAALQPESHRTDVHAPLDLPTGRVVAKQARADLGAGGLQCPLRRKPVDPLELCVCLRDSRVDTGQELTVQASQADARFPVSARERRGPGSAPIRRPRRASESWPRRQRH